MVLKPYPPAARRNKLRLTSGGVLEVVGSRLKIDDKSEKNGLYFIDKGTSAQSNYPCRTQTFTPHRHSATTRKGEYSVQVTTQYSGGGKVLQKPTRWHIAASH